MTSTTTRGRPPRRLRVPARAQASANPGPLGVPLGVVMQPSVRSARVKSGRVEYVVGKEGEFKDIGSFARAMTGGERRSLDTRLDDVHGQFIPAVGDGPK